MFVNDSNETYAAVLLRTDQYSGTGEHALEWVSGGVTDVIIDWTPMAEINHGLGAVCETGTDAEEDFPEEPAVFRVNVIQPYPIPD